LKIAHVHSYYMDGWGYQENVLPKYQLALGHEVVMITSDRLRYVQPDGRRVLKPGEYGDNGVRVRRLSSITEFRHRFVVLRGLYETLVEESPDCILVHEGVTSPTLFPAVRYRRSRPNTRLFVDNHSDLNISARNRMWRYFYYSGAWRAVLSVVRDNIDLFFGVTPARCYFMTEVLSVPPDRVRLLPIGVDTVLADPLRTRRSAFRESYGFRSDDVVVITGGKFGEDKGLESLIHAVDSIDDPRLSLVVFGKFDSERVRTAAQRSKRTRFVGWLDREQIMSLLVAADVAVWPSIHTTLVEDALAAGTPLLLRYHGSTSHHIRGNGMYLFGGTSIEIAQCLQMWLANRDVLGQMRDAAERQRETLSYWTIAAESVEYCRNLSPGGTHRMFMADRMCSPETPGFRKVYQPRD